MIDIQLSTIKDLGQWWIQVTKVSLLNENWANETLSCFVQVEFSCRLKRWKILERNINFQAIGKQKRGKRYFIGKVNTFWSYSFFMAKDNIK